MTVNGWLQIALFAALIILIAAGCGCFAVAIAYTYACDRL